jgi:hypothetical protein
MAGKGTSDMMGSKADMISKKLDEVKRNKIWMEHVDKEDKEAGENAGANTSKFQHTVNTLIPITLDPNRVDFSKINELAISSEPPPPPNVVPYHCSLIRSYFVDVILR